MATLPTGYAPGSYTGSVKVGGEDVPFSSYYPAYLGGEFPSPSQVSAPKMQTAPYQFIDPSQFAQGYAGVNTAQYIKNFNLSKQFSLDALNTELLGLQNYAPAASALKRQQTSVDTAFNQAMRSAQVNQAMPGVAQSLAAQAARANSYAQGKLPDSLQDRAAELNIRSQAADQAAAGGFGAASSVAQKASNLMSVNQRLQYAQYGENLLGQNIQTSQNLLLAPTEYSNAGSQINVNPPVSTAQIMAQQQQAINEMTMINPQAALQMAVQQNQYATSLEQQTRQINTQNTFSANQLNAAADNNFALTDFQYKVGFAGTVAGAAQTGANTQMQLQLANQYMQIYKDSLAKTQNANTIAAVTSGLGSLLSAINQVVKALTPSKNTDTTTTETPGTTVQLPDGTTGSTVTTNPGDNTTTVTGSNGMTTTVPNQPVSPDQVTGPTEPINPNQLEGGSNATPEPQIPPATDTGTSDVGSSDTVSYAKTLAPGSAAAKYAAAAPQVSTQLTHFSQDTGVPVQQYSQKTQIALKNGSNIVLQQAGLSKTQAQGMVPAGTNQFGEQLYTDPALKTSNDTNAGKKSVSTVQGILDPFGVLGKQDISAIGAIGDAAADTSLALSLTQAATNHDAKGFVNTLLQGVGLPALNSVVKDPQNQAGIGAAADAYNLYANWNTMSPAQKSLGIAALGIKGFHTASGINLGDYPIVKATTDSLGKVVTPELTVGTAMNILSTGMNVYNLATNWNQLSAMSKAINGTSTVANIVALADKFHLISSTTSAVTGGTAAVEGAATATEGAAAATEGATAATEGAATAAGGVNAAAQGTGVFGANPTIGGVAGDVAGAAAVAAGTYQVYKGWGEGGVEGRRNGILGGASIASGLAMMGYTNPYLLAAVVAVSVVSNSIKTGKPESQNERDAVREGPLTKLGMVDKDYNLTLADGTKANVGIDGHGGYHEARNPDEINWQAGGKNGKLQAYDVDYSNDLDYFSGMAGTTLSRLVSGGKGTGIDQVGGQIGNAALGNIGFGKDMTQANFDKMAANQRAFYAKAGITSKDSAIALATQALKEGRINETDFVTATQSFNMIFDKNGYQVAEKLNSGRRNGINNLPKGETQGGEYNLHPDNMRNLPGKLTQGQAATAISGISKLPPNSGSGKNINLQTIDQSVKPQGTPAGVFQGYQGRGAGPMTGGIPKLPWQGSTQTNPVKRPQAIIPYQKARLMNVSKTQAQQRNRTAFGMRV